MEEYYSVGEQENLEAVFNYIKDGYLEHAILDVTRGDKVDLICDVCFSEAKREKRVSLKYFFDLENSYLAALRVLGDKSKALFNQLNGIKNKRVD